MKKSLYLACIWCGKSLPEYGSMAQYCSKKCRVEAHGGYLPKIKAGRTRGEYLKDIKTGRGGVTKK